MGLSWSCTCYPAVVDDRPFVKWIAFIFHQCYYSPTEVTSFILGLLNILLWLIAQVPQVIKNFIIKDGGAISLGFMVLWLIGDVTNLLGCIFTDQLPTQLYVSVYYCCMDVIILSQMFGFAACRKYHLFGLEPLKEKEPPLVRVDSPTTEYDPNLIMSAVSVNSDIIPRQTGDSKSMKFFSVGAIMAGSSLLALCTFAGIRVATGKSGNADGTTGGHVFLDAITDLLDSLFSESSSFISSSSSSGLPSCVVEEDKSMTARVVGSISAWVCFVCYVFGRVPQIILNYKRKATEGLSLLMFFFATAAATF